MTKGKPKRDGSGRFMNGIVPCNKIILSKDRLEKLYGKYGSSKIASILGVSKPTVLRNLTEYNIPKRSSGAPSKLPEYWKKAMRKKKSVPSDRKGKTKANNKILAKISNSLKGEKNSSWRPEIHTGEKVECMCGCKQLISKYDKKGRRKFYVKNHCKKGWFIEMPDLITEYGREFKKKLKKEIRRMDNYTCQECNHFQNNMVRGET